MVLSRIQTTALIPRGEVLTRRAPECKSGPKQMPVLSTQLQEENSPHANDNPFPKLHSPRVEAFALQKMIGHRNGRVITAEEIVNLISISENIHSILLAYAAADPSESANIHYILHWRRTVLEEFARLTGVELPATSQPENKPAQSAAAVTNVSCRTCIHRQMFFERVPGKNHPEVNVKCAKGHWPAQRFLTFERNKKNSRELASDCPDFHKAERQAIPGA